MKKKVYTAPQTEEVKIMLESLLAESLIIDSGQSGNQQLSNGKSGWDSSNWSAEEEE